jgi:hypothetical protein
MKKYYLLIALFLCCYYLQGQTYLWGSQQQLSEVSNTSSISVSPDQSVFTSGSFTSIIHDSTSRGGYISKYTSDGILIWIRQFFSTGGPIRTICSADNAGNVYVSGHFKVNMYSDNFSFTNWGLFLLKYDANGNLLFSLTEENASAKKMMLDSSNNIYLVGTFQTDIDSSFSGSPIHSSFLAKYNSSGSLIWVKDFFFPGQFGDEIEMEIDAFGNLYQAGKINQFGTYVISDSVQLFTSGQDDGFVAKYNSEGDLVWVKMISGPEIQQATSVAVNDAGDIFVSGFSGHPTLTTTSYFDSIAVTTLSQNKYDLFVAKYDASGNCIWVRTAGGNGADWVISSYADSGGRVYATGVIGLAGDSATFADEVFYSDGRKRMFLVCYDPAGNQLWADAASSGEQVVQCITGNDNGEVYAGGGFAESFDIGTLSMSGTYPMFLMKIQDDSFTTIGTNPQSEQLLQVYPNPSHNLFRVVYSSNSKDPVQIVIRNVLGQNIYSSLGYTSNGVMEELIDLSEQSEGVYLIDVVDGEKRSTRKILRN